MWDRRKATLIKRFVILRRKPGMSVKEFRKDWKTVHGPLIAKIPGLLKYTQYHVRSPAGVTDPDEPNLFQMDTQHIHPVMTDEIVEIV